MFEPWVPEHNKNLCSQQVQVVKTINEDIAGVRGKLDARAKSEKKKEKLRETV